MAPLTSTPTPTMTANLAPTLKPESQEFAGDEFSNNLFSDLAPLLTLFGEQVTKQFLSMSMGWADNILLAMGPLGILTTVVSAIRVGGVKNLKSLVGRARESLAVAEQELLSSTSDNVCEMWSGTDIVRQLGKPKSMELILVKDKNSHLPKIIALNDAIDHEYMRLKNKNKPILATTPRILASQPPNIALNSEGSSSLKKELWWWAFIGIILQLAAIVFPALATYFWEFSKADSDVQDYAYPCFTAGTLAVVFGVILCSHVIEGVTDEATFEPTSSAVLQVTRLQLACTVSDQSFESFLIMNPLGNKQVRLSRLSIVRSSRLSKLAGFASLLTVAGFICQFVGLRGLHWSATIFQLGVTLVMTGVRSWVRRGLSVTLPCVSLRPEYELEMTALLLLEYPSQVPSDVFRSYYPPQWKIITGRGLCLCHSQLRIPTAETQSHSPTFTTRLLSLQRSLTKLVPGTSYGDKISRITSSLVVSMTKILDRYENAIQERQLQVNLELPDRQHVEWSHGISYWHIGGWKYETVSCRWEKTMSKLNENQSRFESILRFSMFSSIKYSHRNLSKVVIGYGDLQKRLEFEDWLFPAPESYEILTIPSESFLEEIDEIELTAFGVSTLPFPLPAASDSEFFFAHIRPENLLHEYAIEILSGFMNSIAASIETIGGTTEAIETCEIRGRSASVKQNSVLMSFSQVLIDCGLAKTMWEAKSYIIPPFANRGLLPSKCGDVTFDEPVRRSRNSSSTQITPKISMRSANSELTDQSKQATVPEPVKEIVEDKGKSALQLEDTVQSEVATNKSVIVNGDQEKLPEKDFVAQDLHSSSSASECGDDGERKSQQE